jgi:PIN domain nuclease of toxin-antitoxin system
MAHRSVVDTHALIWYLEGNPRLGSGAKTVLDNKQSDLVLPIIALAEAVEVVAKGRSNIPAVASLLNHVQTDPRLRLFALTWKVFRLSLALPTIPEMHDRLIVASALFLQSHGHSVDLLTKDTTIVNSGLVPVFW